MTLVIFAIISIGIAFYFAKRKNASIKKSILIGFSCFVVMLLCVVVIALFSVDIESSSDDSSVTSAIETDENRYGQWTISEYVNDFDEPTGEKYVFQKTTNGSFSNSATTNSELTAEILIDKDDVRIMLKEYGKYYAKDEEFIAFQVKRHEEIVTLRGFNFINNQGYITIDDDSILKNILLKGGEVKFYGNVNNGRSTYNFSFNGDKLKEALQAINISCD